MASIYIDDLIYLIHHYIHRGGYVKNTAYMKSIKSTLNILLRVSQYTLLSLFQVVLFPGYY